MASNFHELPLEVFDEEARPHIRRLNSELRNLFGLEGTITSEPRANRSDRSIARNENLVVSTNRVEFITDVTNVDRVIALGAAPAKVKFRVLAGPPDKLYVSMQMTGGVWVWLPLLSAP